MLPLNRWNHNLHFHPLILAAAPNACRRALDVGCGEGVLTRDLCAVSQHVVGIDCDTPALEAARSQGGHGIEYVLGDVLTYPFAPASFDLITSVAVLHHLDAEAGLRCMADLLRPGGVLVVIGLAHSRHPVDFAYDLAGVVSNRVYLSLCHKQYWEHSAPKAPPPLSYDEVRHTAERVLPGVHYQRHALWRYVLTWTRP